MNTAVFSCELVVAALLQHAVFTGPTKQGRLWQRCRSVDATSCLYWDIIKLCFSLDMYSTFYLNMLKMICLVCRLSKCMSHEIMSSLLYFDNLLNGCSMLFRFTQTVQFCFYWDVYSSILITRLVLFDNG